MRQRRSLSKKAFDQAIARCSLGERATEMARAVLVNGQPATQVAQHFGVTGAAVSHHVRAVWQAHTDASALPPGFVRITVVLPEDKASIAQSWERDEKIKLLKL